MNMDFLVYREVYSEPGLAILLTSIALGISFSIVFILYNLLNTRRVRVTNIYLSGEPENAVSSYTPSISSMYWGFMKKFAKSLYRVLVEKVHTGSLHDWYHFLSSWLAVLIMLSIIVFVASLLAR